MKSEFRPDQTVVSTRLWPFPATDRILPALHCRPCSDVQAHQILGTLVMLESASSACFRGRCHGFAPAG